MKAGNGPSSGLITVLIYTRVSSDDQAREGVSLDAQLTECRRYSARDGWVIGNEYTDVLSGTRDDRPAYQQLLTDVRRLRAEGRRVVVVVAALDRFGRKLLERVRSREELKALGVPTYSIREGGEVSDLTANILGAVAEEEVRRLGERVRAVRGHLASIGWRPVGRCPWGYRWRAATPAERQRGAPSKVLDVDPAAAACIRDFYERVGNRGESIRSVSKLARALPAEVRGGRALAYQIVRGFLTAPVYIARADGPADVAPLSRPAGNWPALIDDDLWARVQERIALHQRIPRQASGRYLLSGLIRCGRCGSRMSGCHSPGRYSYVCSGSLLGASAMDATCRYTVTIRSVDTPVLAEVGRLLHVLTAADAELRPALRRAWERLTRPTADRYTIPCATWNRPRSAPASG